MKRKARKKTAIEWRLCERLHRDYHLDSDKHWTDYRKVWGAKKAKRLVEELNAQRIQGHRIFEYRVKIK